MNKFKFTIAFSILLVCLFESFSQQYVNREWGHVTGLPEDIGWTASTFDNNGNLYVTISPNPANDIIEINTNDKHTKILKYEIFDLSGKIVKEKGFGKMGNSIIFVSIELLYPGLYTCRITTEKDIQIEKIVKI